MIDSTILMLASVIIGVVTFVITFRWGVISYKNQMNAQLFLEFTKRYDEILQSFPRTARSARFNLEGPPPGESEELTLSILQYLNLCSEEFYLYKKGWLDEKVWKIWEEELVRTLRAPLLMREWKKLAREFNAYSAFRDYVDRKQASK
jgi:hypothetical protein